MEELNLMEIFKQRQLLHPSPQARVGGLFLDNDYIDFVGLSIMMVAMKAMSWKS